MTTRWWLSRVEEAMAQEVGDGRDSQSSWQDPTEALSS